MLRSQLNCLHSKSAIGKSQCPKHLQVQIARRQKTNVTYDLQRNSNLAFAMLHIVASRFAWVRVCVRVRQESTPELTNDPGPPPLDPNQTAGRICPVEIPGAV